MITRLINNTILYRRHKLCKLAGLVKQRCTLNKQGVSSIIYVIFMMILIIVISGFIDVTGKVWTINEFQSMMDLTAHNVLYSTLDLDALRYEILKSNDEYLDSEDLAMINSQVASDEYKQLLIEQFETQLNAGTYNSSGYDSIFEVVSLDIKFQFVDWALGDTTQARPQVTMDSYVVVTSNGFGMFDNLTKFAVNYTNAQSGAVTQIEYGNTTNDGKTILFIRNMTRLIYR